MQRNHFRLFTNCRIIHLSFLLFFLSSVFNLSFGQSWKLFLTAGGKGLDRGKSVCADMNGNILITGFYKSSTLSFGQQELSGSGEYTSYLAKYDSTGNVLWVLKADGSGESFGNAVITDAAGNVYWAGSFKGDKVSFGQLSISNKNPDESKMFLVKCDPSGKVIWAISGESTGSQDILGMDINEESQLCLAGYYTGDKFTIKSKNIINKTTSKNILILKIDSGGNPLWIFSPMGTGGDYATGIKTDYAGNVFVTGVMEGDSLKFGKQVIKHKQSADVFVAKLNKDGQPMWARSAGKEEFEMSNGIAVDNNGSCYVTGYFGSKTIGFSGINLSNSYGYDMFIVKYDSTGKAQWAKTALSDDYEKVFGIATDRKGNSYVCGIYTASSLKFGGITIPYSNAGVFIVKYSSGGDPLWVSDLKNFIKPDQADQIKGDELDPNKGAFGESIFLSKNGTLLVAGSFYGKNVGIGNSFYSSKGDYDIFILKIEE